MIEKLWLLALLKGIGFRCGNWLMPQLDFATTLDNKQSWVSVRALVSIAWRFRTASASAFDAMTVPLVGPWPKSSLNSKHAMERHQPIIESLLISSFAWPFLDSNWASVKDIKWAGFVHKYLSFRLSTLSPLHSLSTQSHWPRKLCSLAESRKTRPWPRRLRCNKVLQLTRQLMPPRPLRRQQLTTCPYPKLRSWGVVVRLLRSNWLARNNHVRQTP